MREAETQAEGEGGSLQGTQWGTHPRTPGSRPGSKADAQPLSHPGVPSFYFLISHCVRHFIWLLFPSPAETFISFQIYFQHNRNSLNPCVCVCVCVCTACIHSCIWIICKYQGSSVFYKTLNYCWGLKYTSKHAHENDTVPVVNNNYELSFRVTEVSTHFERELLVI